MGDEIGKSRSTTRCAGKYQIAPSFAIAQETKHALGLSDRSRLVGIEKHDIKRQIGS